MRSNWLSGSALDRRVTLVINSSVRGPSGSAKPSHRTIQNVPAKFEPVLSKDLIAGGAVLGQSEAKFFMRWRNDLGSRDQIIFGRQVYEVLGQPMEIGRRDFIEVLVRARNAS